MKQGLFLIFAFCAISNAYAQMDCESIPSCAELGYTQASCPEGNASLKCPFDETKFYCIGGKKLADAPAPVVTPEDWTAECADTIAHCTTLDSSCRCTACESGYLLSNGNCVAECAKSVAICAKESKIFKADTCTCESCPTNYQFNAITNSCEQNACDTTKVENCATYDSEYEPCECTACEDLFSLCDEACYASTCSEKCMLYEGEWRTRTIVSQRGSSVIAAYAVSQFYIGDKNGDFGQNKWYLPAIGEWMEFYGTDASQMTSGYGISGAIGNNKTLINNALNTLADKGVDAEELSAYYWSSSEYDHYEAWRFSGSNGFRVSSNHHNESALRSTLLLKNIFNTSSGGTAPQIGDVMYLDKTYGSAEDYDGSKEVAGIIAAVSKDECDVKIINLRNLTFSSKNAEENFDPDNPYSGRYSTTSWGTTSAVDHQYCDYCQLYIGFKDPYNCSCQF